MWCSTHSEHRRRSAGLMMMQWGLNKADAMGLDCFVNDFWADARTDKPTTEWESLKKQLKFPMHGYFMWRPPGGKHEEGSEFPWE